MSSHGTDRNTWLIRPPSSEALARVFLLPYAGSGAGLFRGWPKQYGDLDLLPVELPGRETRLADRMPATFQDLAARMIDGLAGVLDRPYAFFGHCWSALLAYEVTAQLERSALPAPVHLFVSSQVAPHQGPVGRMLGMTDAEMADELATTIRALGGQPHPALVSLYVEVLRTDVDVSRKYVVPDPAVVSCPVTAIGWTADEEVVADRMGGWTRCGRTDVVVLEGRHHRFVDAPRELMDVLRSPMLRV